MCQALTARNCDIVEKVHAMKFTYKLSDSEYIT